MHWPLPAVAAVASAAFAVAVLRQYAQRRRPHQLAWAVALTMFAVASTALTLGVAAGWTVVGFKVYYLFGAILNVPWLALGTVELLAGRGGPGDRRGGPPVNRGGPGDRRGGPPVNRGGPGDRRTGPIVGAYLAGLTLFTATSAILVVVAVVDPADLAGRLLPEGKEFLPAPVRVLAVAGNTVGTAIVVGGAVASGLAMRHRRDLRPRFEGNILIALGVLLAAGGGVFAFLDSSGKLALGLALGASVMYLGFRRASAPARPPVPTSR